MSEKLITLDQERLHADRVKGFLDRLNDTNDLIVATLDGIDTRVTNLADSINDLSIKSDKTVVNENLLVNTDFDDLVNQLGETTYTSTLVYGHDFSVDCWGISFGSVNLSKTNDKYKLVSIHNEYDKTNALKDVFVQSIPNSEQFRGEYLTASILVDHIESPCKYGVGVVIDDYLEVFPSIDEVLDEPGLCSVTFKVPNNAKKSLYFQLVTTGNSVVRPKAAKLERGTTSTLAYKDEDGEWVLYKTPDYNEELLRCLRRFVVIDRGVIGSSMNGGSLFLVDIPFTVALDPAEKSYVTCSLEKLQGLSSNGFTWSSAVFSLSNFYISTDRRSARLTIDVGDTLQKYQPVIVNKLRCVLNCVPLDS